jgi:RNA recognition motif-containing protein
LSPVLIIALSSSGPEQINIKEANQLATKTLYVGNIPYSLTEGDLVKAFSAYGGNNARIIEGRGFAFIDIDGEQMQTAITDKDRTEMDGRTLTVNEAKPRENRSSGGGGNSGGGGYGGGKSRGSNW